MKIDFKDFPHKIYSTIVYRDIGNTNDHLIVYTLTPLNSTSHPHSLSLTFPSEQTGDKWLIEYAIHGGRMDGRFWNEKIELAMAQLRDWLKDNVGVIPEGYDTYPNLYKQYKQ
jgi:hypothetical protein